MNTLIVLNKKAFMHFLQVPVAVFLVPGLVTGRQHREQEYEEQKPLCCPGSDPAAEREKSNYHDSTTVEKQTYNREISF